MVNTRRSVALEEKVNKKQEKKEEEKETEKPHKTPNKTPNKKPKKEQKKSSEDKSKSGLKGNKEKEKQTPSPKKSPQIKAAEVTEEEAKQSPVAKEKISREDTTEKNDESQSEFEYEFGGPFGSFCVIVLLPVVIYALFFLCNKDYCLTTDKIMSFDLEAFKSSLPAANALINDQGSYAVIGWMCFHILLERILPGEVAWGTKLSTGETLTYCLSGHLQFWVTILVLFFGSITYSDGSTDHSENGPKTDGMLVVNSFQRLPLEFIYDEYLSLITASLVLSFILSVFVYVKSFVPGALLAIGGNSGNIVYDFFIGRELNPRIGSFDIKEFCELRPGLIGWMVINLGMAAKQMQQVGFVSLSMVLINVFQGFYVWDALHAEKSILSTMDITTDGFGFMLAFGDLAWVPFIYSLQSRYLVDYDPFLDNYTVLAIFFLQCFGYYVFRAANSEKDTFRRNPQDPRAQHLTYLETKRGTRLITSGWWGLARKINYTGDWIMTLSWCLLCGFKSPVPYFQAVYFLILLVHRAIRDDKMCHEKYGDDWIEYKKRVPYVFIPFVI